MSNPGEANPAPDGPPGTPVQSLAGFNGRYSRGKFWLWSLGLLGLMILMIIPLAGMNNPTGGAGGAGILFVMALPFLWLYCKLIVHRLHDLGWSGWWFLLLGPLLIPLPTWMWIYGHTQEAYNKGLDAWLEFGAYGIFFGGFILLGCIRGTEGRNAFGPDPLAPKS